MPADVRIAPNLSRVMFGLAVILAGVLFTLDNLRIIQAESYLSYWPVVVILIGLTHLAQSATWGGRVWGAVIAFAGAWILGENLGYVSVSVWTLSPLLLVLLGASIIWRGCCPPVRGDAATLAGSAAGQPADGKRFIQGTVVMGAFESNSDAADFRGGDLMMIMAGAKIDLRQATIEGHEAIIDMLVILGGVELRIPETWTVDSHVLPMIGGVTNHARTTGAGAVQRLVLRGNVFMGGVEIKN